MTPAGSVDALIVSLPPPAVDRQRVVGLRRRSMFTCAGSPVTATPVPLPTTLIVVVAAGAVDDHGVGRAVAGPLPASRQVERRPASTSVPVRSLTVIVSAPPRALKLDPLDVVEVHGDVADVAGEAHPPAVGRDVDVLVDVGAVEQQRVGAVLAFDDVAAVARVPDEGVVAGAEQRRVVAAAAVDEVVAVAAEQHVVAVAAGDGVVAGAAVDGELDQGGEPLPAVKVSSPPLALTRGSRWCRCRGRTARG